MQTDRYLTLKRGRTERRTSSAKLAQRRSTGSPSSTPICVCTRENVRLIAKSARSGSLIWATSKSISGPTRGNGPSLAKFATRISQFPPPWRRICVCTPEKSRLLVICVRSGSAECITSRCTNVCTTTSGPTSAAVVRKSTSTSTDYALTGRRANASPAASKSGHLLIRPAPMLEVIILFCQTISSKLTNCLFAKVWRTRTKTWATRRPPNNKTTGRIRRATEFHPNSRRIANGGAVITTQSRTKILLSQLGKCPSLNPR